MLECSKDVDDEETLAGCERRAAGLQIPVYIAHRGNVAFVEEARVGDYGGDGVDELLALVDCDLGEGRGCFEAAGLLLVGDGGEGIVGWWKGGFGLLAWWKSWVSFCLLTCWSSGRWCHDGHLGQILAGVALVCHDGLESQLRL
jgi:hypothetical protein